MTMTCPRCGQRLDPLRAPVARVVAGRIVSYCSVACSEEVTPLPVAVAESVAVAVSESASESVSASESESVSVPAPPPSPDPTAVRSAIASSVRYPRLARTQGLEGTVLLRFHIDASGAPSDLSVLASAGALLDSAATDAVHRAAPFHSPPGWVRVPVVFSLHDAP